jgi:signal transduction histidine kinase
MTFGVEARLNQTVLGLLPPLDQQRWLSLLEPVDLGAGQILCGAGQRPTHAYFPLTAVVSVMYITQEGDCSEVAVVGWEGLVGLSSCLGGRPTPTGAIVQRAGRAVRVPVATLRAEVEHSSAVRQVMLEYSAARTVQVAQTAVCNCHHMLDQRVARRLLEALDRQAGVDIAMTHEQLARLLGVRRESITAEVDKLQKAAIVRCSRGHIVVADRHLLEQRACECYAVVKRAFECTPTERALRSTVLRRENSHAMCGSAQTVAEPAPTFHLLTSIVETPPGVNGTKMNTGLGHAQAAVTTSGELATYLQRMRDEERADLARELHDELGSLLTGAKLELAMMKMHVGDGSVDMLQRLQHLGEIINSGISFSRRVVEGLHPSSLTNLGLAASLQILAREFQLTTGIAMVTDLEDVELDQAAQLTVYRVVQECLNNTSKHAGATDARVVMLGCGSHAIITVRDNGRGFDTVANGAASHGLAGMHHRVHASGGHLTVSSARGLGTVVTAVLHARSAADAAASRQTPASLEDHVLTQEERARSQRLPQCKRRTGRPSPRDRAAA